MWIVRAIGAKLLEGKIDQVGGAGWLIGCLIWLGGCSGVGRRVGRGGGGICAKLMEGKVDQVGG